VSGITRERQDAYALESQQRTARAQESGYLDAEIVAVEQLARDEFPRPDTTLEALSELRPSFAADGSVTAGNSSGINDGAAAIAVLSAGALEEHGVRPRARIVDWAVSGVEPELMGRGPVPATEALMARTGLEIAEVDVFEVNEAFASVVLNAIDKLGLPPERTNINGGAISLGHPPGATGLRMVLAALNELDRREGRYALITMCLGGGQGMSMVIERVAE
jgi:acetyl-CoA acetyltransferase family protein